MNDPKTPPEKPDPKEQDPAANRRLMLPVALILYGMMAVAAVIWLNLRDRTEVFSELALGKYGAAWSLAIGSGVGLGCVGLLALLLRYFEAFQGLDARLSRLFGELRDFELVGVSMAVAVGEELFFRAAMMDAWGLWITALVYGALNTGPGLILWGILCVGFGIIFGYTVQLGGGLLAVTVAHALLNYFYLGRLPRR